MTSHIRARRIIWGFLGLVVVGVAAYVAAVFLTRRSLENVGRALAGGVSGGSVNASALPAGSVLLLDGDTVASLVSVARASGPAHQDSTWLYAAHAWEAAQHRLSELRGYAAVRQAASANGGAERLQLVRRSDVGTRTQFGTLILRGARDSSALQTFPVF